MNNINVSWVFRNLASQTLYQTAPLEGYGDIQYIDLSALQDFFAIQSDCRTANCSHSAGTTSLHTGARKNSCQQKIVRNGFR